HTPPPLPPFPYTTLFRSALLAMFGATRTLIQEAFDQLHAQQPDMADAARNTHTELYAAISEHDADRAGALMRTHLEEFATRAERSEEHTSELQSRGHLVC